jgi:hypothetical protein
MGGTLGMFSTRKPEQDLCYRRSLPNGGIEEGCDPQRLGRLAAGGVVLFVSYAARPTEMVLPAGESLVVDGHDARISQNAEACATAMGGDGGVTLTISQTTNQFVYVWACALKVPGLDQTMRRIAASTRLAPLQSPN